MKAAICESFQNGHKKADGNSKEKLCNGVTVQEKSRFFTNFTENVLENLLQEI